MLKQKILIVITIFFIIFLFILIFKELDKNNAYLSQFLGFLMQKTRKKG